MPTVTVAGAHGQTVTLAFDTEANAVLARKLAAAITAGVHDHSIVPATDEDGPPPPLAAGKIGEFVQTHNGVTSLPAGYRAVVDTAHEAVIFGSGDADESVLSSIGKLTFIATGGSGTVAAGGGDNRIVIPAGDNGNWSINTGNGDDIVLAFGGGNNTISAGGGDNAIQLGSGNSFVQSTGDDTVNAGSGTETISVIGKHRTVVHGNSSDVYFVTTDGSATVLGGTGSDTFFGGSGPDFVQGGTGGHNLLFAGTDQATLFGGGDGDQLYAAGKKGQELHAGAGNETLFGGFSSGQDTFFGGSGADQITGGSGNDTFVAGTGSATITAGFAKNMFVFNHGEAGGSEVIHDFTSGPDKIDLQGYGDKEVKQALKSQTVVGGNDTITLSDHTTITFIGVSSLSASDFITTNGAGGDDHHDHGNDDDHGHHGHGDNDHDGHSHIRDAVYKHD